MGVANELFQKSLLRRALRRPSLKLLLSFLGRILYLFQGSVYRISDFRIRFMVKGFLEGRDARSRRFSHYSHCRSCLKAYTTVLVGKQINKELQTF